MGVVTGFSGYGQWVEAVDVATRCGHWVVYILFHNEKKTPLKSVLLEVSSLFFFYLCKLFLL